MLYCIALCRLLRTRIIITFHSYIKNTRKTCKKEGNCSVRSAHARFLSERAQKNHKSDSLILVCQLD